MPETLRDTLDHLLEGFQVIGHDWRYLYVNPVAAQHGQSTPEALVGKTMEEAYPGIEQTELFAHLRRAMADRVATSMENLFVLPDGTSRWFELRIVPVPEGVCVHSVDIDARKRTELEIEERVALRTREVEAAYRELEAFSYSVSHDLRGPLRSIDGFAQALAEDCGSELGDVGLAHLARIRNGAARMARIIDALLALAHVTRTPVTRLDVDLSAIARSVVDEIAQASGHRRVRFDIASGLRASCDPSLARIVIQNLFGNAWKFTSKVDDAVVELGAVPDRPGTFFVRDNGAGFDMKYAGDLFGAFKRLHHERDFPGTGIGLATVRRIVEKHGGSVTAEGVPGKGATMTFSFGSPD